MKAIIRVLLLTALPSVAFAAAPAKKAATSAVVTNDPPADVTAALGPVRNPFWPIGYHGMRAVISDENRAPVVVKKEAFQDDIETATDLSSATPQHWAAARRSLRITGTAAIHNDDGSMNTCVIINGMSYADGDVISINHHGRRFTWRIVGLTSDSGTLRLERVRVRRANEAPLKGQSK